MIIETKDIILVVLGLYIGLLLSKHTILTWDRACSPFVGIAYVIKKIFNRRKNDDGTSEEREAPKL